MAGADPRRTAGQTWPPQQRLQGGKSFWRWRSDVPVGFDSAEVQSHPDAMGKPDFGVIKLVKWQIPVFDG